jgi:hypothetical protein
MGLFGKKKLSEIEAAGQFVVMVSQNAKQHWPSFAKELNTMFNIGGSPVPDTQQAALEFVLAVIATQIQALPNLLPLAQASRVREYVILLISSPDLGSYPRKTIQEYQDAWDQSRKQNIMPLEGIVSILSDKLGLQDDAEFGSPLLLLALSEKVMTVGGGWWKTAADKYKLVP